MALGDTYALKQTVYEDDPKRKVKVARYMTLATGLTWQEAKARRNRNRDLNIVPERAQAAPVAVAMPEMAESGAA